ncbi:MAG: PDDEXK nuclease domain-containing protein [Lentimicrobiaceae bacterium]|nr:PDDEXK nuclease domain-containing protein [Lentimicrobiaceae bacterium]
MGKVQKSTIDKKLLGKIRGLIEGARNSVSRHIDRTICNTYFLIGRYIVEDEQHGQERAGYADEVLKYLGKELTKQFGRGFSARNLANMKKFYLTYQTRFTDSILQTLSAKSINVVENESDTLILQNNSAKSLKDTENELINPIWQNNSAKFNNPFPLSWSHYLILCRIDNPDERSFYEIEAINSNWKLKELERQFNSSLYERLVLSRDKKKVKDLSEKGQILQVPADAIKNPLVLEFLGLKEESEYSESDLEKAIIDKLEHFLLEMGKGFLFAGRQVRISFEEEHFYLDLVLYNRLLKSFVLIDLKIGKLRHQDLGQMQMYVNYYDRHVKTEEENNTIGIVICKDKKDAVVEMTLPENNRQIFASKYQLYLPSKEEIRKLVTEKEK